MLGVDQGGTGASTFTDHGILYGNGASAIGATATGNSSVLVTNGSGVPSLATDIPTAVTIGSAYIYRAGGTDIPVSDGGTGASTLTDHGVLVGSGTSAITALTVGTNGQVLVGSTGADPVFATITDGEGITTTAGAGTLTIACEDASTSNKGVLVTAGNAKALAGTDTASAVTPDDLKYVLDRLRVLMTGQVTITNANTGQPHWLMTTALTANVSLPYSLPNANYTVLVEVEDADFKERVGEIKISSKAINGFTITVTGNTNNIDLRWTVVDPNYWTR